MQPHMHNNYHPVQHCKKYKHHIFRIIQGLQTTYNNCWFNERVTDFGLHSLTLVFHRYFPLACLHVIHFFYDVPRFWLIHFVSYLWLLYKAMKVTSRIRYLINIFSGGYNGWSNRRGHVQLSLLRIRVSLNSPVLLCWNQLVLTFSL